MRMTSMALPKVSSHKSSKYSGANPDFSSSELVYQLKETKASVLIVHPDAVQTALAAAKAADISSDRVVVFDGTFPTKIPSNHRTVGNLISEGLKKPDPSFVERTLKSGEGRTKLAFLSFSSGTTGKPKVRAFALFFSGQSSKYLVPGCSHPTLFSYNQRDPNRRSQ